MHDTIARWQLRHIVAFALRHPDVGSIKGHANGELTHVESPHLDRWLL